MPPVPTKLSRPPRSSRSPLTQGLLEEAQLSYAQQRRAWLALLQSGEPKQSERELMRRYGSRMRSGLALKPLYASQDVSALSAARGALAPARRWRLAQLIAPAETQAPRRMRAALASGAEMLVLHLPPPLPNLSALQRLLPEDAQLPLALWQPSRAALRLFFQLLRARKLPHSYVGFCHVPAESADARLPQLLAQSADWPQLRLIAASGADWQARGADEVHELAAMCALALTALRAFDRCGIAPAQALPRIALQLTSGSDFFASLVKLRAARLLWAQLMMPLKCESELPQLHVHNSTLAYSRQEPWLNLLRATSAALAAGIAGCDSLMLAPHDISHPQAERLAAHVQSLVREESHIGEIADAAAGSWYLEHASEALAQAAWAVFQEIERRGGFARARAWFARACRRQRAAAQKACDRGLAPLLGVNSFVDLAAKNSGPRAALSPASSPQRLAEGFEQLRAQIAALSPASTRPFGALVRLDGQASDSLLDFARNLFASGGLACRDISGNNDAQLLRAYRRSGAAFACLIGGDAAAQKAAAQALRQARARAVYIAAPKAKRVFARGLDGALSPGMDALRLLRALHARLGIAKTKA